MFDQIVPDGGKLTVVALVEKYISLKTGVRPSTEAGYKTVVNLLKKDEFGSRRIDKVKISDAKAWLIQLQKKGRGFSTIRTIRGILRPAFQLAVDDDVIRKNPFGFELVSNRRLSRAISADYFRRKHLSQSAVNEAKAHYIGCHRRLSWAYFSSAMAGLK